MRSPQIPVYPISYNGRPLKYIDGTMNHNMAALLVHQGYITDAQRVEIGSTIGKSPAPLARWHKWFIGENGSNLATPEQCIKEVTLSTKCGQLAIILHGGAQPIAWLPNHPDFAAALKLAPKC